jgi:hypothetical protein
MNARPLRVRPHLRPKPHHNLPQLAGIPPVPSTWKIVRKRPGEPLWYLVIPLAKALAWPVEGQA